MESDRNKRIACNVLKGYAYRQVGLVYGISGQRARAITNRIVSKVAPGLKRCKLKTLRSQHKNILISLIEGDDI
jgi:hypothetical protein